MIIIRIVSLLLILGFLTGCDTGFKQLGPTEYGVRFRKLPPIVGGGLAKKIEQPGEMVVVWPWDEIYALDTKIRTVEWGDVGRDRQKSTFVETRAIDGNEVSLAVRVQYHLSRDADKLLYLVQNVGTSNEAIEEIVVSAARSDIRTYMNKLKTSEFFNNIAKYNGEKQVRDAMSQRLEKHGIIVQSVNLKEHRFERVLSDGAVDRSYQERINQVQTLEQETEREKLRKDTVIAEKSREFNNVQAQINRILEEAEGIKRQSQFKGDGYYAAKSNDAKTIKAEGESYVKGLQEQINALNGPGGRALLKLELAKSLLKSNPKFILMNNSNNASGQGVEVRKTDTNELIGQIGIFEGLKDDPNKNLKEQSNTKSENK